MSHRSNLQLKNAPKTLEEAVRQIEAKAKELSEITSTVETKKSEAGLLSKHIEDRTAKIAALDKLIETKESEAKHLDQNLASLRQTVESLSTSIAEDRRELKRIAAEYTTKLRLLTDLLKRCDSAAATIASTQASLSSLEGTQREAQDAHRNLLSQIADAKIELGDIEKKKEETERKIEEALANFRIFNERIHLLTQETGYSPRFDRSLLTQ